MLRHSVSITLLALCTYIAVAQATVDAEPAKFVNVEPEKTADKGNDLETDATFWRGYGSWGGRGYPAWGGRAYYGGWGGRGFGGWGRGYGYDWGRGYGGWGGGYYPGGYWG